MKCQRIHIAGGPGSGKSYAAKILAKALKLPHHELDECVFDPKDKGWKNPAPVTERKRRLSKIIKGKKWIVDGAYRRWVTESYKKADLIIVILPPLWKRQWRIINRYLTGRIQGRHRDTLTSTRELLGWSKDYEQSIPSIKKLLKPYKNKTYYFSSADEAIKYLISK